MTDYDKPKCHKCHKIKSVKLRKQIMSSGGIQVMWYCLDCESSANQKFVKKSIANAILSPFQKTVKDLPTVVDYSQKVFCIVCGSNGAEFHHWLPQCFAEQVEDHSRWPGAYLCKECHDIWHELVTPYLPGRGQNKYAQFTKEKYLWLEQTT